ncbi:MAG: ATPase, T2SS/T4P/T4SS family [Clostridia bacterium]|jgi:pilus assembly protein CpaF
MEKTYESLISSYLDSAEKLSEKEIEERIAEHIYDAANKDMPDKAMNVKILLDSVTGYSMLQPLIEDESVTEIMVNGKNVFYERAGFLFRYDREVTSENVNKIINILCRKTDRVVNQAEPIMDGTIGRDIRVNIVLEPISKNGNAITIRKFPKIPITSGYMLEAGFFSREICDFLKLIVKSRYNIFICGGAGSGKTTLLNVLTDFIPRDERVITIEDSAELNIDNIDNIVRLESRNGNSDGKGEITIDSLIKSSLRMRPDRIIVGEVREKEALSMLQAMNTGHDGSISTGHANSCKDAFTRLETMVLMGCDMPLYSIRKQIANAIETVIFLGRIKGKRLILEIAEVCGCEDNEIVLNTLFEYSYTDRMHKKINDVKNTVKMERSKDDISSD